MRGPLVYSGLICGFRIHGIQFDPNAEAVIGQPNVLGQYAVGLLMPQVVGDVREPGLARADAPGPGHGLRQGGVAGVRLVAQR